MKDERLRTIDKLPKCIAKIFSKTVQFLDVFPWRIFLPLVVTPSSYKEFLC
jgi:hypothetical protein